MNSRLLSYHQHHLTNSFYAKLVLLTPALLTYFPQDENKQLPSSAPKKQSKPRLSTGKDRSVDSAVDKQRQEARKRLMAAKKAVSVRQNSATESADSIEIYVPEAQTRL